MLWALLPTRSNNEEWGMGHLRAWQHNSLQWVIQAIVGRSRWLRSQGNHYVSIVNTRKLYVEFSSSLAVLPEAHLVS